MNALTTTQAQQAPQNQKLLFQLWHHLRKAKYAGLKRVTFVSHVTIIEHNLVYEATKFLEFIAFTTLEVLIWICYIQQITTNF